MNWITYFKDSSERKFTKPEGEMIGLRSTWQQRPATDEEITAEMAKRAESKRIADERKAFESRPEYIAAMAIRSRLEWISPEDHPLDLLTVEEWESLRKKLD